jgi:hypothetical protein
MYDNMKPYAVGNNSRNLYCAYTVELDRTGGLTRYLVSKHMNLKENNVVKVVEYHRGVPWMSFGIVRSIGPILPREFPRRFYNVTYIADSRSAYLLTLYRKSIAWTN